MDVKTAFLNGIIHEEVYVEQPHDFEIHGRVSCMQAEEILVWDETRFYSLLFQDRLLLVVDGFSEE